MDNLETDFNEYTFVPHFLSEEANDINETTKMQIKCYLCDKDFEDQYDLEMHDMLKHNANNICKICGNTFSQPVTLQAHFRSVHEGVKKYSCHLCGKCFSYSGAKSKHIASVHEGIKNHACNLCDKAFSTARDLKKHISGVHDGVKNYACDQCGKSFNQPQHLKTHISHVHHGLRNHPCSFCDRNGLTLLQKSTFFSSIT